jgi:hypothetical protein
MAFDYLFKAAMKEFLRSCEAREEKVGKLPLEIDIVAYCKGIASDKVGIPLLERHFSDFNLLDYKSDKDKPEREDLSKLLGYVGLFCDQHGIGIDELASRLTAWHITAFRPAYLDDLVSKGKVVPSGVAGVYDVTGTFPCPARLVICDELDIIDENIPLLASGSIETKRRVITHVFRGSPALRRDMKSIINRVYIYYHNEVKDMTEMNEILPADIRSSMKAAIMDMGLDQVIKDIGLDAVIKTVGIDEVIKTVGIDELLSHIDAKALDQAIKRRKIKAGKE